MDKNIILLIYVLFVGPFSIGLFIYGFFPIIQYDTTVSTPDDIPQYVENIRVKTDELYKPMAKKLIIMVIDALKWDFIAGPIGKAAMPVTSNLLLNSTACLLKTKLQAPTVTMPRIKAVTSGTIPGFIDIALNLGSKSMTTDNILLQARKQGHKLIFYGDETWLTLFPNTFERYDGTTSFFATDFTEVDNNVTRHINNELNSNDWSIMILHYLGLDHIGHIHGPFSPLIKVKLKEMDDIINQIQLQVQNWNQNHMSSLFIICGDHGMKDSGGHGGSTISETTVPFIAIGGQCFQENTNPIEIAQIDIGPTVSAILGVPIPFSNLGTVFVDTLYNLPISRKLFILYYNSKQIFHHFQKLTDYKSQNAYRMYVNAVKLHVAWLNTSNKPNDMVDDIITFYHVALKGMKDVLTNNLIKYDIHTMTLTMFFLFHVLCISIGTQPHTLSASRKVIYLILTNISLWLIVSYFWEFNRTTMLFPADIKRIVFLLCITIVLCINCYLLAKIKCTNWFMLKTKNIRKYWIFVLATLIHAISFTGSSFVEEEHQTWYFFWATLCLYIFYINIREIITHLQYYRDYKKYSYVKTCIKLLLILIGHRILRKLNSTGDKYAHLPDISGWLTEQESKIGMTLILIIGLTLLIWICFLWDDKKYRYQYLILNIAVAMCIYLRHMANKDVIKIPLYPTSKGIYEVQIFWILLVIVAVSCIYESYNNDKIHFLRHTLFFVIKFWVTISAMIHQPYNVILLPMQIIFSCTFYTTLKHNNLEEISIFAQIWIGNVFYFYQGNSNSLATIDIAAGYVGLQSYIPFITGTFLIINTYSAVILAYLLYIHYTLLRKSHETYFDAIENSRIYVTWKLLPMFIYTLIIIIQRHHLFIWTVFSPKLLYEAVHVTVICFIIFITLNIIILQHVIYGFK